MKRDGVERSGLSTTPYIPDTYLHNPITTPDRPPRKSTPRTSSCHKCRTDTMLRSFTSVQFAQLSRGKGLSMNSEGRRRGKKGRDNERYCAFSLRLFFSAFWSLFIEIFLRNSINRTMYAYEQERRREPLRLVMQRRNGTKTRQNVICVYPRFVRLRIRV
ncbi:hypothetical protein F5051DRAFT_414052 [Lentinula edodes]|nr:hypothetical protein F5051DRAFT_414052 [Lentinula edodes]